MRTYQCSWHDPVTVINRSEKRAFVNDEKHVCVPSSSTNNSRPSVLTFDRIELEIQKLADIPDERQDLTNPLHTMSGDSEENNGWIHAPDGSC